VSQRLATGTPQTFPVASRDSDHSPPRKFPPLPYTAGLTAPGPDPPDSSRCPCEGRNNAGSSRTPFRHTRRARTIWQYWHVPALSGLLPPSPAPPGSGCPQLHRPAATDRRRRSLTSTRTNSASRRKPKVRQSHRNLAVDSDKSTIRTAAAPGAVFTVRTHGDSSTPQGQD
jgi:hypothetical protein